MNNKPKVPTHTITYQMENSYAHSQKAYGKTDLFNCLRDMMKAGYTYFEIKTLTNS